MRRIRPAAAFPAEGSALARPTGNTSSGSEESGRLADLWRPDGLEAAPMPHNLAIFYAKEGPPCDFIVNEKWSTRNRLWRRCKQVHRGPLGFLSGVVHTDTLSMPSQGTMPWTIFR